MSVLHIATAIAGTGTAGDALIVSSVPHSPGPVPRLLRDQAFNLTDQPPAEVTESWAARTGHIRNLPTPNGPDLLFKTLMHQHIHAPRGRTQGLLEGRAGTALALQTAATNQAPKGGWDKCLLIS